MYNHETINAALYPAKCAEPIVCAVESNVNILCGIEERTQVEL